MPEQSTTPDLVALTRRTFELASVRDWDALLRFYGPGLVWDMSPLGLGVYQGPTAIRGFFEDWTGSYEQYELDVEQVLDLGNGVVLAVALQRGRLPGAGGWVELRYASVVTWAEGLVVRITNYGDLDEGRAAAERLAASME
jgi:ketosteroid isomerase-like protein